MANILNLVDINGNIKNKHRKTQPEGVASDPLPETQPQHLGQGHRRPDSAHGDTRQSDEHDAEPPHRRDGGEDAEQGRAGALLGQSPVALCFGNAAVESKGDPPIRRIVKGTGHLGKIDPIHGLLDALYCFDLSEGRVEQ